MGLFQSIKNLFTKKKETQTTQSITPTTSGVIVTDYTSGESVTTESSGGQVTKQTYTPAPSTRSGGGGGGGGGSQQLGETQALALANRPEGLVSQTFTPQAPTAQEQSSGSTLQPSKTTSDIYTQSTVSGSDYTGEPPTRYERPLGSAIKESFSNAFNFGVIGTYGVGAYLNQAFIEPFEYVGKPKAYDTAPNYALQNWRGTEFGYGLPESQKNIYRPAGYQTETYFEQSEKKKRALYEEAGLQYTGQPTSLIPLRVGEQVSGQVKTKYEEQFSAEITGLQKEYQGKVDTGELSVAEATKQFEERVSSRSVEVNAQYQAEVASTYQSRISGLPEDFSKRMAESQSFEASIFTPPAYPIIKGIGKAIETGAIIGATAFGGSGLTLAASSYIGIKTASQGVKYAGGFGEMTTSQKILGGAGLAAGAAATYYTFNLGVTKFYSEWRGIIYSDLARSPAQVRGQEVYRSEEVSIYKTAAIRQSGVNKAITLQRTDVYPTGVDRVGFYARGVTKTTIYDPQYERYISSVETFRSSGYIPNIKEGVTFGSGGIKATPEGYFGGLGSGKYITQKNIKDFSFVAATKDEGQFYRVAGGVDPQRAFTGKITTGGSYYSTAIQARYDSSGIIAKLQDEGYSNIIITSGAKSSQAYFNNLYGVGAAGSAQITKQAGTLAINDLVNTVAPSSTQAISSQAASQAIKFNFAPQVSTSSYSQEGQIGYTLPALSQLMPQTERESSAVININNASFADLTNVGQRGGTTPAFAFAPALATATAQGLRLRQGMLNPLVPTIPNYFNPPDFTDRGGKYFDFDLGGLDIGLPSQIIKGGKRKTGYTPSFSALVFNLRGAYSGGGAISKSGIDFRPITRGFAFNTGVGGIGAFRKLLKRK